MKPMLALAILMLVPIGELAAQAGRDNRSRDAGSDARIDAMLGTPNRQTPTPQAPTTTPATKGKDAPDPSKK